MMTTETVNIKNTLIQCIEAFNGEYSILGIAKILTGYSGFRFIPKLKQSKLYGILKNIPTEKIIEEIEYLKEKDLIRINNNLKVFTTKSLDVPTNQKDCIDDTTKKIINHIENKENLFITGGAGTGKSYLLNQLKFYYKNKLEITSTTGISALNISGQTIHSWAGIGICDKPTSTIVSNIKKKPILLKQILLTEMLAIDEISMLDNNTMDYLNDVLKLVRASDMPFGGIQVLLFGDFFQLPPVGIEKNNNIDFCFNSKSWEELNLKTITLKEVKRQTDSEFIKVLNNVRKDKVDVDDMKVLFKCDYEPNFVPPKKLLQIFSTNNMADSYNAQRFNELETKSYKYIADDELYLYDKNGDYSVVKIKPNMGTLNKYDQICIKNFNEDCKAPQTLELKVGCRVMLLKNRNIKAGLVNGSCGTVTELSESSIKVLFDNKNEVSITQEKFEYIQENRPKIKRKQYPLRLAYGITIHKSQGMTFDSLVVNFNRIFDYGQAYVALSRTRSLKGLIIKGFDPSKIKANPKVIDFYKSIEEKGTYQPIYKGETVKKEEISAKHNISSNDFSDERLCEIIVDCVKKFNNIFNKSIIPKILVGSKEFSSDLKIDNLVIKSEFYGIVKNKDREYLAELIEKLIEQGILKTINDRKWTKIYTADIDNYNALEYLKVKMKEIHFSSIDKIEKTILQCVSAFDNKLTRTELAQILTGSQSKRLLEKQKRSCFYGIIKTKTTKYIKKTIDNLFYEGYLDQKGYYRINVSITESGKNKLQVLKKRLQTQDFNN